MLGSKQLTIRDAYRIKSKLNKARSYCLANSYDDIAHIIANCTVLPLLVFIEREDIDLFRKITRGSDYDALYEYGKHFEYFIQNIRDFLEWQGWVPGVDAEEEAAEESIEPFVHDLCVAIYGRRRKDEKFREAQRNLGGCAGFDSNVYERLQFD